MINIKNNLDKIKAQIQQACQQNGRLISAKKSIKTVIPGIITRRE